MVVGRHIRLRHLFNTERKRIKEVLTVMLMTKSSTPDLEENSIDQLSVTMKRLQDLIGTPVFSPTSSKSLRYLEDNFV